MIWRLLLCAVVPLGALVAVSVDGVIGVTIILCALAALAFESGAGEMPEPTVAGTSWICSGCRRLAPVLEMRAVGDDVLCPTCLDDPQEAA